MFEKSKTACNGGLKLDTLDVARIDFKFTMMVIFEKNCSIVFYS